MNWEFFINGLFIGQCHFLLLRSVSCTKNLFGFYSIITFVDFSIAELASKINSGILAPYVEELLSTLIEVKTRYFQNYEARNQKVKFLFEELKYNAVFAQNFQKYLALYL